MAEPSEISRLDSVVADATREEKIHAYRGLKPTAKFRRRYAAGKYALERK
jgi:hypothetical protein